MNSTFPQYRIVTAQPRRSNWRRSAVVLAWLLSLLVTGAAVWWWADAGSAATTTATASVAAPAPAVGAPSRQVQAELERLRRQVALLEQSDRISRAANLDLQDTLAQRETQIADLRSDVAFYARLVGPTAERKGLGAFSTRFSDHGDGAFGYRVVLTQTLNRGAISSGKMQFSVEGTREGRREVLDWAQLHPGHAASPQAFSFRYFQELNGNVVLPAGFTPHRVRVSLLVPEQAPLQREFDWTTADA
ncbi:DUF6776 family protein [Pseudoxanthomonas sp. JBR18]|uniref:DUF6776 family protein n=1 Tax=Pseudoxanthomonas sp. JBR18 TaxID=2969308 RepID=UPI00230692DD|nr:DUF6776 family protein [Pseudoxanthomonas sp. JBR18]WCE02768.1 hypothetical protein PJ250_11480 [Pseudoxanthomonas sp. JBR18]